MRRLNPVLRSSTPPCHRHCLGPTKPSESHFTGSETNDDRDEEPDTELHDREHEEVVDPGIKHVEAGADAFRT